MFVEAIEKFQELDRRLRKLEYGEHSIFNGIRKEAIMLLENFLPNNDKYLLDLNGIKISEKKELEDSKHLDQWIAGHTEAIGLLHIIIEDLKIKQRKAVAKSESKDDVEKVLAEIDRIKNDTGKDLILEKNNYNYLKRKYDLLQYNYNQLQADNMVIMGKKNNWILYFTWTVLLSLIILVFDQFIDWHWFDENPRKFYMKLSALSFIGTVFTLLPFGKNWRIIIVSLIVFIILILLAIVPV